MIGRHFLSSVETGQDCGPVSLHFEVEGGRAWISASINEGKAFGQRSTSASSTFYESGRWMRMEEDPRSEWPRFSSMTAESTSVHLVRTLGLLGVPDSVLLVLGDVLVQAVPVLEAAIILES